MVMDIGAIWQGGAIYPSGSSSEGPGNERDGGLSAAGGDERRSRDRLDRRRAVDGVLAHHAAEGRRSARAVHGHEPEDPVEPGRHAGLPAYAPDQDAWLKSLDGVFANPAATEAAIKTAAGEIWTGWSPVPWSVESIFGNTRHAGPHRRAARSRSALTTLAGNIKSAAQSAGWQVKG